MAKFRIVKEVSGRYSAEEFKRTYPHDTKPQWCYVVDTFSITKWGAKRRLRRVLAERARKAKLPEVVEEFEL